MTSTLEHIDVHSEIYPELSENEIAECDLIAMKYLMISTKELKKSRRIISRLQSVYYKEASAEGGALLVCADGSLLFAGSFVTKDCHFMAFENGLRTSARLLLERKDVAAE